MPKTWNQVRELLQIVGFGYHVIYMYTTLHRGSSEEIQPESAVSARPHCMYEMATTLGLSD